MSVINDYFNIILSSIGLPEILSIESLKALIMSLSEWWQILQPDLLFSIFAYLGCMYAFFFATGIMFFRLFKKISKTDKKRGK